MGCSSSPCSGFGISKPVCRAEQRLKVIMFYELHNYQCLGLGWEYLSEEKMDRAHLVPFLSVGSSSGTNHSIHCCRLHDEEHEVVWQNKKGSWQTKFQ